MKTLRSISTAFYLVIMCTYFISCSEEELIINEDGIVINQKKLVEMEMTDDYETVIWNFFYDTQNRLTHIVKKDYDLKNKEQTGSTIRNITWENSTISIKDGSESSIYTYDGDLIRNNTYTEIQGEGSYTTSYIYKSSNQLHMIVDEYDGSIDNTFTWKDGKIIKGEYTYNRYNYEYEFSYSGKTCKGWFPLFETALVEGHIIGTLNEVNYFEFFCAHPELIGLNHNNLVDKIYRKDSYGTDIEEISYTLDNDKYVKKCTIKKTEDYNSSDPDIEYMVCTFTWE